MQKRNTYQFAEQALALFTEQADAILNAAALVDCSQLEKAIELLAGAKGKLVLFGTGKSGIAARKIAATFTSTGTSAMFLHPMDALHGDLGIVNSEDVAVGVSNGGETEEVLALLPHLRKREVPVVAIVGNKSSSFALQSDVVINLNVEREAGHLHLAPTTSTTVAIAMGDALALILMRRKNFSEQDFAFNHPAGRLGKRLTTTVGDLMHSGESNPRTRPEATLIDVLSVMTSGGLGATNVVDEKGRLVGVITDGDVRRWFLRNDAQDPRNVTASQVMTDQPLVVNEQAMAFEALELMEERPSQISVLPVVGPGHQCIGLIRLHDLVRAGLR